MKPETPNIWYLRERQNQAGLWLAAAYRNNDHDDGEVLHLEPGATYPPLWDWRTFETDSGILRVEHMAPVSDAPPMWFVFVDEPKASPAAANLVAFTSAHREPGTIISRYAFQTLGVDNDSQIGAVRWYRSGVVHQIFVPPAWRRRFVATSMLVVADAFHQANGWPGHLRSDGRRTSLGKLFAAGTRYPRRFAPLEQTMPPMDPPEQRTSSSPPMS